MTAPLIPTGGTTPKVEWMRILATADDTELSYDPAMALAVTQSQYRRNYLIHAPTNYESSYANITAPDGAKIVLDGTTLAAEDFLPIGSSGYGVAREPLSNTGTGDHTLTGNKSFGVSVYGYGQYTSYWYAGGLDLENLEE